MGAEVSLSSGGVFLNPDHWPHEKLAAAFAHRWRSCCGASSVKMSSIIVDTTLTAAPPFQALEQVKHVTSSEEEESVPVSDPLVWRERSASCSTPELWTPTPPGMPTPTPSGAPTPSGVLRARQHFPDVRAMFGKQDVRRRAVYVSDDGRVAGRAVVWALRRPSVGTYQVVGISGHGAIGDVVYLEGGSAFANPSVRQTGTATLEGAGNPAVASPTPRLASASFLPIESCAPSCASIPSFSVFSPQADRKNLPGESEQPTLRDDSNCFL